MLSRRGSAYRMRGKPNVATRWTHLEVPGDHHVEQPSDGKTEDGAQPDEQSKHASEGLRAERLNHRKIMVAPLAPAARIPRSVSTVRPAPSATLGRCCVGSLPTYPSCGGAQ